MSPEGFSGLVRASTTILPGHSLPDFPPPRSHE